MSKMLKKPTRTKKRFQADSGTFQNVKAIGGEIKLVTRKPRATPKRKPLLVVTKPPMLSPKCVETLEEFESQAKGMGYDLLVLPYGASVYVAVTA